MGVGSPTISVMRGATTEPIGRIKGAGTLNSVDILCALMLRQVDGICFVLRGGRLDLKFDCYSSSSYVLLTATGSCLYESPLSNMRGFGRYCIYEEDTLLASSLSFICWRIVLSLRFCTAAKLSFWVLGANFSEDKR